MVISYSAAQRRRAACFALVSAVFLFSVCLLFVLMLRDSLRQKEALDAAERFRTFETRVERLIYSNVTLLEGFEAYINAYPDLDGEHAYRYLRYLLRDNWEYIQSIGVMQDTTMLWSYPQTNSEVIGVDLSQIEAQREQVLRVKEELRPVFQGPIDLVQGGAGFSVRLPIIRDGGDYWGQVSIVLKTDALLAEIRGYAAEANLDIAIFTRDKGDVPLSGAVHAPADALLAFNMDPAFIDWQVYVNLSYGWTGDSLPLALLLLLSAAIAAAVGIFVFKYLKSSYRILNMSIRDALTGLYNRHFLDEHQAVVLSAAARAGRSAAILMLDLDNFKAVNDTYGHSVGDRVLAETARVLKSLTRAGEAVFRLGGDEFLIMLPEVKDANCLSNLQARLSRGFEEPLDIPGHIIQVTFSGGSALYPQDGEDLDALLRVADKRLYLEKQ